MIYTFKVITLLIANVFENFRNKWYETYNLEPVPFLLTPGLTWQV